MKKRGSSLVELLAVIVILGIISAIAVPTISALIKNSKKKACRQSLENIEISCKYLLLSKGDHENFIGIDNLVSEVFVDSGGTKVNEHEYSGICSNDGNYTYEITSVGNLIIRCSEHTDLERTIIAADVSSESQAKLPLDKVKEIYNLDYINISEDNKKSLGMF